MCGITCCFGNKTITCLSKIIQAGNSLKNRGPDSISTHISLESEDKHVCIFTRLAIMDTTITGNQPFISGNILLMCNGEIYNHEELTKEYNLQLTSHSDCEVIIRLYEKIKDFGKIVSLLHGVYAIVLIDGHNMFVARDRIGIRPLFLGESFDCNYSVGSTVKSILPFTHANTICSILPGYWYCFRGSWPNRGILYKMNKIIYPLYNFEEKYTQQLFLLLASSVKKRLMSDRPIGCLLSGGLDSSIIAYLLCNFLGAKNVRTYSIGLENGLDLKYAKIVANYLGTQHTEVKFTIEEGLDIIPTVIKEIESYDTTTVRASVGMYLLCKYIKEHTTDRVIFSGEGSDELFCGYLYFHNAPTKKDAHLESLRLVQNLHLYDVLRADRCVSSNGLELRVPFLDNILIEFSNFMAKKIAPRQGWEKFYLRKAFEKTLPKEVIWRRKDGFSDAVSGLDKPWYMYIQEYVENRIPNELFDDKRFSSKEEQYYRLLFDKVFYPYDTKTELWLPKWSGNQKNPSGRLIHLNS